MTIILLFGGKSPEYEISLKSAAAVLSHIDHSRFSVYPVGITPKGVPYYYQGEIANIANGQWEQDQAHLFPLGFEKGKVHIASHPSISPDVVFPMLHGDFGEDGRLQGMLDCLGIPYVGCGPLCSAVLMHKHFAKLQFQHSGIPTAKWVRVRKRDLCDPDTLLDKIENGLDTPEWFVKPATGGSSIGASAVSQKDRLLPALANALRYSEEALVEQRIFGLECEVGVLDTKERTIISRPAGILTSHSFYDFEAKYKEPDTRLALPAPIPHEAAVLMQTYAKRAFLDLGCRQISRFDFFYTTNGQILLSEVNTMPGMTERSLYPQMMQDQGIGFSALLTRLICGAV